MKMEDTKMHVVEITLIGAGFIVFHSTPCWWFLLRCLINCI